MNDRLLAIAVESRLWRAVVVSLQAVAAAWASSRLGQAAASGAAAWTARPPAERLSFGAAAVAWALIWLLAGQRWLPPYAGSGLPQMWFASAAIVAALVSLAATPLVLAWGDSRLARLARSLGRGI